MQRASRHKAQQQQQQQQQNIMTLSPRSKLVRPPALRMALILSLCANADATAADNARQGIRLARRALQACTVGDSFSVVAPAVPDMEGCYVWDVDYRDPAEGLYGYFHEDFGPDKPRYVSGGPSIGWELSRDGGTSCRSALNTSAPEYPVEATWLCDADEFGVGDGSNETDVFVELEPSAFFMVCDSTCPSALVGVGDDDTATGEDFLDDDALAETVDDDLDGGGASRMFTAAPSVAPTAAPSPPPTTTAPSIPLITSAPTSAANGDQPRSSPTATAGPSSSPTAADGGGDDSVGEGDAESRASALATGCTAAATGAFAAILAMVVVAQ